MRRVFLLALPLCAALGCGSGEAGPTATPAEYGPHGGPAVPLPDRKGFGEVVIEPADSSGRSKLRQIAVYFLAPDLNSTLEPLPTEVEVKLRVPGRDEPMMVPLEPKPDDKSAVGKGRFTSAPADYQIDQVVGELKVAFGAESSSIPFAGAR